MIRNDIIGGPITTEFGISPTTQSDALPRDELLHERIFILAMNTFAFERDDALPAPARQSTGTRFKREIRGLALVFSLACSLVSGRLLAQQEPPRTEPPGQLASLDLQALMNLEVTSVSRRPERLSDAAASVFVITGDDIRRSGATNLPEAL